MTDLLDLFRNGTVSYWFDDFYREYCLEDEGGGGGGGGVGGGSDFWGDDSFFEGVSLEEEKNCTDGGYITGGLLIAMLIRKGR